MSIRKPPTVMVRNTPTLTSYLSFLSAQALLEAIAIPVEFQHMATMRQVGGFSTITRSLSGWLLH
jgi:hypothetical protein